MVQDKLVELQSIPEQTGETEGHHRSMVDRVLACACRLEDRKPDTRDVDFREKPGLRCCVSLTSQNVKCQSSWVMLQLRNQCIVCLKARDPSIHWSRCLYCRRICACLRAQPAQVESKPASQLAEMLRAPWNEDCGIQVQSTIIKRGKSFNVQYRSMFHWGGYPLLEKLLKVPQGCAVMILNIWTSRQLCHILCLMFSWRQNGVRGSFKLLRQVAAGRIHLFWACLSITLVNQAMVSPKALN